MIALFLYGGVVLNKVFKVIRSDFKRAIRKLGITVDITYETPESSSGWGEIGVPGESLGVKCLNDIVSDLNIKKYPYAEIQSGKNLFFVPWDYDLTEKQNIKVLWNSKSYFIKKVVPHQPLGDEFLCQLLIQE